MTKEEAIAIIYAARKKMDDALAHAIGARVQAELAQEEVVKAKLELERLKVFIDNKIPDDEEAVVI